jgi:hypothetical protein
MAHIDSTVEVVVTDEFASWYAGLATLHRESVIHSVGLLEQLGTQLPFPHSSALQGSRHPLRELRVKAQGAQIRIAYVFDATRDAVLLLGAAKVGDDRFYRWFIPQAEKIWEQYLKEQQETP